MRHFRFPLAGLAALGGLCATCVLGCTIQRDQPNLVGQDVRITVIHTADIHSRLLPYNMVPNKFDQDYGLALNLAPYGGVARMGYIIKDIRASAPRSIWLDSGDAFQGAPIFNAFHGEVEFRALSRLGLQAAVVGNHEFDQGTTNLVDQITHWADFPELAANYLYPGAPELKSAVEPYTMIDVDGVKFAVIGMANQSSMTSITEAGNSLGIRPRNNTEVVEDYVRLLRPAADVVVLLSHLGLSEDEGLVDPSQVANPDIETLPTDGVDLILGGHLHIVLNPPNVLSRDKYGHPTVLVDSGAFAKYVGRLDMVVHIGDNNAVPSQRSYIKAFSYNNIPVTDTIACPTPTNQSKTCPAPVDPDIQAMLQPYALELNQELNLKGVFAWVNVAGGGKILRNDPSGGDSQLGNLVARSMQRRQGVDADFALTNSLGIRTDFQPGALTLEQMYNVFPFENTITIMNLSGVEVKEMLDFVARRSSQRGCRSQAQVAGIFFTLVCGSNPHAQDIYLGDGCRKSDGSIDTTKCFKLNPNGLYRVAVNNYIAAGGSGFQVLKRNTSKEDTGISLRAALMDYIRKQKPCDDTVVDAKGTPVIMRYGPIACLDENIEAHDGRIYTVFQ